MGHTSDAGEKILRAAHSLFDQRGYSALGLAEICRAAGVPRGSFHYFFASKEALALSVLDAHWAAQRRVWLRLLGSGAEPLPRLRALFEATGVPQRDGRPDRGTVAGCMFANLAVETGEQTEAVRQRLREIFEAQVGMVESVVSEARRRGEVSVSDPREAARSVMAQLEGRVLFAKLYDDAARLGPLWVNCLALLGARCPQASGAGDLVPAVPV
ncbi:MULTISPECIES: TetR/AcrR family transcriptional regulator [unclassified Streptomyces]|uniref:TetR/AcrR family transcriptional regulator n=1 Tax=unclassified Streptomyces TaxID=2593676 RepID=UPI000367CEC7|nr:MULTISPECIES: TetR/AcrR family transcriptional regulator [unclassified Streptomyces]MYX37111.1 TetR family transcriptional regulator [Streptomyces sp. SID8377]